MMTVSNEKPIVSDHTFDFAVMGANGVFFDMSLDKIKFRDQDKSITTIIDGLSDKLNLDKINEKINVLEFESARSEQIQVLKDTIQELLLMIRFLNSDSTDPTFFAVSDSYDRAVQELDKI